MYTSGIWVVKEGREDEFVRRWEEATQALSMSIAGLKFMLLRDRENRQRFVSLGEGWRNHEQFDAARETPQYQDAMAALWRMLDDGQVTTLELTVEVS